jgi:hypothetical protein
VKYDIAIPSYQRPKVITEKTLKLLDYHGIDPARITVFVASEEELEKYKKTIPHLKIIVGVPTIGAQRNFIERYYPEGTRLMMFDDDVQDVQRKEDTKLISIEKGTLERDIIIKGFEEAEKAGAKTFGIYAASNAYFMKERIYTKLCYIIASMFGVIVEHDDFLARETNHGEDYEYSIRQYIKNGAVCRLDYITVKSNYYKEEGGLQLIRTPEYIKTSIEKIAAMFPEHCTMYIRPTTGHAELRLKDRTVVAAPVTTLEEFFS